MLMIGAPDLKIWKEHRLSFLASEQQKVTLEIAKKGQGLKIHRWVGLGITFEMDLRIICYLI